MSVTTFTKPNDERMVPLLEQQVKFLLSLPAVQARSTLVARLSTAIRRNA